MTVDALFWPHSCDVVLVIPSLITTNMNAVRGRRLTQLSRHVTLNSSLPLFCVLHTPEQVSCPDDVQDIRRPFFESSASLNKRNASSEICAPSACVYRHSSVIRQVAFLPSIAHRWPSAYSALLNEACQVSWDDGLLAFRCVQGIVRVVRCFSASGQPGSIDLISRAILPLLNPKYAQKWKNTATFFIFRRLAPTIVGLHPLDVEINTFSKYLNLDWTPFRGEWHHPMHFP